MIKINEELCKGCAICIDFCPVDGLLHIDEEHANAKGWNPVLCTDQDKCLSCSQCALMCPDAAITVFN